LINPGWLAFYTLPFLKYEKLPQPLIMETFYELLRNKNGREEFRFLKLKFAGLIPYN
jgi:hypothetical protein